MVVRFALLAALASACYSPAFQDCELACSPAGDCPAGFECNGAVCRPVGATMACPAMTPDAPGDGSIDGPPGLTPHPTTMWGAPTMVVSGSMFPGGVDDASLTGNMLEIFVTTGNRILTATRQNPSDAWGPFAQASGIINYNDPTYGDDAPYVSSDGLTMYWMSNRPPSAGNDIWMATRPAPGMAWANAVHLTVLNSNLVDSGGSVSADGLMLALTKENSGTSADLYLSTRTRPVDPWGTPTLQLAPISQNSNDSHPILSPDKLTLYFHSDREGATLGYELYEVHRTSETATWGTIRRLAELSTMGYDADPWVSPDGRTMYFTRTVGGVNVIMKSTR